MEVSQVEDRLRSLIKMRSVRATQRGPDPRQQFVNPKRLGDKIIGANVQRLHLRLLFAFCRQDDNRNLRDRTQTPAQLETINTRHCEIGDYEVRMPIIEGFKSGQSIRRRAHVVPARLQTGTKHTCQLWLIIHDQDPGLVSHLLSTIEAEYSNSSPPFLSPIGNVNSTRVPLPLPDSIQILPSCASTMPFAIARPIPVPAGSPVRISPSRVARKNLSNTRSRRSPGIPCPSSSTPICINSSPARRAVMLIIEPFSEYFAALSTSVYTTSLTARSSTRTPGNSFSISSSTRCCRVIGAALSSAAEMISSTAPQRRRRCKSPASILARSINPFIKRFRRSLSSLITSIISTLASASSDTGGSPLMRPRASSSSVVMEALIEVRGVRRSCVTASSSADFSFSLCRKASA